jgi:general secretion pathway protein D
MNGVKKQVMIEATIVEVYLNDESQSGINWSALTGGFSLTQNYSYSGDIVQRAGTSTLISNGRITNDWSVSSTLNLLQRYGNSQVLSSPKIVGINNQPTLLKVVKNLVYFTTTVSPGTTTNGVTTPAVFSTTPNTVPVGLVMSVLPSIDQHDQITLVVRPTISNLVRYVEDPNPEFKKTTLTSPVVSLVPEIQEREMESVLKLNDGQVAILGGLIQDEAVGEDTGVPGLVTESTLGYLFGQKNKQKRKTELVIFLRPTLIKHPDIEMGNFSSYRDILQKNTSPQALQR